MLNFNSTKKNVKKVDKPTTLLEKELKTATNLDCFLKNNADSMQHPNLAEFLNKYLIDHNIETADFVRQATNAGFVRQYVYEILDYSKNRKCSQDKLVAIALILKMDIDEAQHMMKYVGINTLYSKNKRDAILIFAINTGQTVLNTQDLLMDRGFEPLILSKPR